MKIRRVVALKDWIAWTLITGGLICVGKVGLDAARATLYQRQYRSALHEAAESQPSLAANAVPSSALGEPIGWLAIRRIGVSAAVVHGDTDALLRNAIGHLADTPLPWSGGNSALAGHRDSFFRLLRGVRPGDMVHLETPHGDFHYRVRATFIVDPEDVWVLDSTGAAMLTLITCYPFDYIGNAPRRFIVRADRIDVPHGNLQTSGAGRTQELAAGTPHQELGN